MTTNIKKFAEVFFEELYEPSREKPVFIVGMPGIGEVGRITVEVIKELTDAQLLCRVYSFYFPDQIQVENGLYELLHYEIHHTKTGGRDVFLLSGDFQPDFTVPESSYTVAEGIVDYIVNLGCRRILVVDGFMDSKGIAVTSNNSDILSKLIEAEAKPYRGYLSGLAGLILGMSALREDVICVGVLAGCRNVKGDKSASLRALRFINNILGLDLNL
ncbi:PAC2 family protein [Candidatus Bathyarchaeota archaeon]|nr:PAC2 family protein [Candidatus Bathyarchaeota archaeon]MBS7612922.1 PAC2 family protein [Candidatus Bathyarchaeota archaeon]MBS7618017.1 PAC2 family protein [Candidatus Bathyarchaeota archaeon]